MLSLIELIAGILDLWYSLRFLAALGAVACLILGLPFLVNLSSSADFNRDLFKGLGYIALAVLLAMVAMRSKERDLG